MHFVGWSVVFGTVIKSDQMSLCPYSHLILRHQGLVLYFPLSPGLEQHAFF